MTLQELQGNVNINVMMKSERCNSRKPMSFSITPSAMIDVFYLDVRAAVVYRFACFALCHSSQAIQCYDVFQCTIWISVNHWQRKLPSRGFKFRCFFSRKLSSSFEKQKTNMFHTHIIITQFIFPCTKQHFSSTLKRTVHVVCNLCVSLCRCWSWKGHYSCSVLTVLRQPMCDCRDNSYQQLLAAVLPERGFVCFGSTGVRKLLSSGLFPSANSPP